MKKLTLPCATVTAYAALMSGALAGDMDYSAFQDLFGEPVTVGATGTPQRVSDVPLNMVILTREDIKRSAARTIPDVLRRVPGVNVRQSSFGGYDVSIRGFAQPGAERILVLLNGRPVYQDFFGLVAWNTIPVTMDEIKQIEVVKGPNTALYGFNATSGVINIITDNPRFEGGNNVTVSGGNNGYAQGDGTATIRNDKGGLRLTASGFAADQFSSGSKAGAAGPGTAIDNHFVKVDGAYEVADGMSVGFELSDTTNNFEEASLTNNGFVQWDYKGVYSVKLYGSAESDYGTWDAMYYRNKTNLDLNSLTIGLIPFDTRADVFQLSNTFQLGTDHIFRLQAEYRDSYGNGQNRLRISQDIASIGGVWNWAINDQFSVSNAVRYDHLWMERVDNDPNYDRELDALSINSGLVYKITDFDVARLTYARAVDLPSFGEFGSGPRSEISVVNNVGLDYSHRFAEPDITASASVFYQTADDMQVGSFNGSDTNPLDSKVVGGEFGLDGKFGTGWSWGVSYATTSTDDTVTGTVSTIVNTSYENSQSDDMVTARLGYVMDEWTFDLYGNYMSGYTPYNTTNIQIDDVYLTSGKINYQVTENINLALTGMMTLSGEEHQQGSGQKVEDFVFGSISINF